MTQDKELKLTPEDYDGWYNWFVDMLNRRPDEAEKNAIRHLVEAQLAKVLKHRLDRPDREKIAYWFHERQCKAEGMKSWHKWEKIHPQYQVELLELADQILALFDAEIKQTIKDDATRCAGYMDVARKQERERILRIVKEYSLDKASVRDDVLEKQAKGWQAIKGEK